MHSKYFCLVFWYAIVSGLFEVISAELNMLQTVQLCCNFGESAAKEAHPMPCEAVGTPEDIDANLQAICTSSAQLCCTDQLKVEERDCDLGQRQSAVIDSCQSLESEKSQSCCEQCKLGRFAGAAGDAGACGGDGAFKQCCVKAAEGSEDASTAKDPDPRTNEVISSTSVSTTPSEGSPSFEASICEQFAPDELCAHHCIPIPGSYRCECRPGFVLMADGKSCKKSDTDRCRKNNPCEQKCVDTGRDVKCACRRGYELMADQKSCIDVDECALKISNCKQNQKCVNTIGSFKCESSQSGDQSQKRTPPSKTCPAGFIYNRQNQVCDDIDECKDKQSCPEDNICTNTIGSFTCSFDANQPVTPKHWNNGAESEEIQCPPGFKYDSASGDCNDVDECLQGLDDCNRHSQICLNTYGRFTCQDKVSKTSCPPGFKINPVNSSCEDINECLESSELCARGTECVNEPGGYDCKRIQHSGHKQSKILNPSPPRRTNNGMIKAPISVQSEKQCPPGYLKFLTICQDIDECSDGSHSCDSYQECENTKGSYICKCRPGFRLDNLTQACEDINECENDRMNDCQEWHRCDNTVGSYQCIRMTSCGTGYTLNAMSGLCQDNDECASGQSDCHIHGSNYVCVNLPGTFRCVRPTTLSTKASTPRYKPLYNNNGDSNEGSYYDEDIFDERPDYIDPRGEYNGNVTRHQDSSAFAGQFPVTTQVTVPSQKVTFPVKILKDSGAVIVNTSDLPQNQWNTLVSPKPEKHCIAGYIMNPKGDCVDVDECKSGRHVCNPQSEVCENKIGTYTCVCRPGFVKDSATAACQEPITADTSPRVQPTRGAEVTQRPAEVSQRPSGRTPAELTVTPSTQSAVLVTPTNSKYLPRFWAIRSCDAGYEYDVSLGRCLDIDECILKTATCAPDGEMCVNTPGGYRCECLPGWYIDHIRHRCVPHQTKPHPSVLPYHTAPPPAAGLQTYPVPTPIRPSYRRTSPKELITRKCSKGFNWDGSQCMDLDECSSDPFPCSLNQTCSNIVGGYICRCPVGHKMVGKECIDIDECIEYKNKACSHHSRCVNTVGSYRCECGPGFEQSKESDKMCQDKDECSSGEAGCEDICINVWGSYRCACRSGFKLGHNNKTCNDVDECQEFADRNICVGQCRNEPGSYSCACPAGYRLASDNRNCIDIDECDVRDGSPPPCPLPNQVCQNTRGNFKCYSVNCPKGYIKQDSSKNRCIRAPNACLSGLIDCAKTPDTYSFNFITFVSRLYIPSPPRAQVDLFTMRGPTWPGAELSFSLRLIKVEAPPSVREPAAVNSFLLTSSQQQAMVSLVKSLQGPQDIELELVMELFTKRTFEGTAIAKIFIYVSPYEF